MSCVGTPSVLAQEPAFNLNFKRRNLAGSLMGGLPETPEMPDYCAEHNITSDVEIINIKDINECHERMPNGDVRYCFLSDLATL